VLNSRNKVGIRLSAAEILTSKHTGVNMGRARFQSAVAGTESVISLNENSEMESRSERKSSCTPDTT
jgi:hypothetical protein